MDQSTCDSERLMLIVAVIKEQLIQAPNGVERWGVSEWLTVSETTLALRVHARYLGFREAIYRFRRWHIM